MLPKMLQDHINRFLEDHIVANWNIKCGNVNTLTIHWKKCNGDSYMPNTHSAYRKKPPSQIRRDQRRSKLWKESACSQNNIGDSGLSISPQDYSLLQDISTVLPHEEQRVSTPIENHNTVKSQATKCEQSAMKAEGMKTKTLNSTVECLINEPPESTNSSDIRVCENIQCDDIAMCYAKELSLEMPESVVDIPDTVYTRAMPTFEEPVAIRFTNVTVNDISDKQSPLPRKYININGLTHAYYSDICSLYYCKRCYVDLKQANSIDCPNSFNLCRDCCDKSNVGCNVCSYTD